MGIGVLIAFVLTFLLLPSLFYLIPAPKFTRIKDTRNFWEGKLAKSFVYVLKKRKVVLWIGVAVFAISLIGAANINANNYLMDDLNPEEQLKVDFDYMDTEFGGVRPFSLVISLNEKEDGFWDEEILKELDTVQNYLENDFGIAIRSSLITALKIINRGSHSGSLAYYKIPETKRQIRNAKRGLKIAQGGKIIRTMLDSTERVCLISGTLPDLGNDEVSLRNDKLNQFLSKRKLKNKLNYRITGSAFLVDKNINYLAESMVKGLALSILIVAFIIGFVYRSIAITLISLIPNLLPLIFIAGIMGFLGIELKTSTAIIFTIAFGIAVDDTIHFLGKFKFELLKGKGKLYALKRSYLTTGKAMILTTLILCSGFILLVLSSFMGTFYMGVLLCATLFIALIADLTLLPVLLLLFYNPKDKKLKK
jgi:predicted RND superfamily exporter protein